MMKESVYVDWLRDAHAMEKHAEFLLQALVTRLDDFPLLRARVEQYGEQTRDQQQQVKEVLKRYDSNWSALKDALGRMSAVGQAASEMLREEEPARIAVGVYVFCHYKVATYTTLKTAAQHVGDIEGEPVFQRILHQEMQMADWLLQQLPDAAHEAMLLRDEANVPDVV